MKCSSFNFLCTELIGSWRVFLGILFIWYLRKYKIKSNEAKAIDLVREGKGCKDIYLGHPNLWIWMALAGALPWTICTFW